MEKYIRKLIKKNPEIALMPTKKLNRYRTLLKKGHRTEEDWDIIKDLLLECHVLSIEPSKELPPYKPNQHILQQGKDLLVFTNAKSCQKYLDHLSKFYKKRAADTLFLIGSLPFQEVMDFADDSKLDIVIDDPLRIEEKYLKYTSQEGKLTAVMNSNIGSLLKGFQRLLKMKP